MRSLELPVVVLDVDPKVLRLAYDSQQNFLQEFRIKRNSGLHVLEHVVPIKHELRHVGVAWISHRRNVHEVVLDALVRVHLVNRKDQLQQLASADQDLACLAPIGRLQDNVGELAVLVGVITGRELQENGAQLRVWDSKRNSHELKLSNVAWSFSTSKIQGLSLKTISEPTSRY